MSKGNAELRHWKQKIETEMEKRGDTWDHIEAAIPSEDSKKYEETFYAGYGSPEGEPFIVWTERYVYFPICYDGAEWVESVPRNPMYGYKPEHYGGW